MIIYFVNGLCFGGLGLAAYLQLRARGDFPLKKELPWLAAFGFMAGAASWIDMFLVGESSAGLIDVLKVLRLVGHLSTGLLLLRFGWGMLNDLEPLPAWTIFIPGILVVPIAFIITYAATTFITPSPIEIPIEIWTRYLLYLPGSVLAGIGFLRQWHTQRKRGLNDVAKLMLGAGLAFLLEAVVVGLVVPAAPYGPASYYNYDRVIHNAFIGETSATGQPYGLTTWLDYQSVLNTTGLSIEAWRMLSAVVVTFFVVKALDVFEAIRKRHIQALEDDRDRARQLAMQAQITARQTAENWTNVLVNTSRRIAELEHVDEILTYITGNVCTLLDAHFVGLAIVNQESTALELKCYSDSGCAGALVENPLPVTNPLILNALASRNSFRSIGAESPQMFDNVVFFSKHKACSLAIVPLRLENTVIGAIWMARRAGPDFSETDLIWLDSMADQVAIAIQHGLMTSQLQSLSIIDERARIAREMHDGLAQVLGYLNLQVQTLGTLLKQGKEQQLQRELDEMRQAVQTAHADVRENILSLRTTLSQEKGLASAVEEYLAEFGIQTGIETHFSFDVSGDIDLASVAEVQLVCILQEALTNVRKHARADQVSVRIAKDAASPPENIIMTVEDNGAGFVPAASKRSFGLQTMRERAQSVGGHLSINSTPGHGTRLECCLPCLSQERLPRHSLVIR